MNKLVKKLMLVAAMLMLAAGPSFAADAIRIGLMCPLTGKWASEGQDMQQIVSLLVSEVNKAGGINGKQIELIVEDDAGDPRTASLAAQKLASAGVMAVIGTYGFKFSFINLRHHIARANSVCLDTVTTPFKSHGLRQIDHTGFGGTVE